MEIYFGSCNSPTSPSFRRFFYIPKLLLFCQSRSGIGAEQKNRIGRITEGLLLNVAETVDIVEPIAKFSEILRGKEGVGQIFTTGLENWTPSQTDDLRYDLIWNQWCLGHLTDSQLVVYLKKCGTAVKEGGLVVVKENLSTNEDDVFDEVDSSVTRYACLTGEEWLWLVLISCSTDKKFRDLFQKAGMKIKKTELQKGMPKELYPVRAYALQPESPR